MYLIISFKVPLGVICKNENKANEMCDIMDDLHAYVPSHTPRPNTDQQYSSEDITQVIYPTLLGGDQLTVARVRGAQKLRCNEFTPADRLEGLILFSQDWHSFVACLEVSI